MFEQILKSPRSCLKLKRFSLFRYTFLPSRNKSDSLLIVQNCATANQTVFKRCYASSCMRYKISACGLKIQKVIFSLAVNLPEKNIPRLLLKRFSVKTMLVMTSKMHTEI